MSRAKRRHIHFIPCKQGSPEWLAHRKRGIGSSEVGGVCAQADYVDPIKVYLDKIGEQADTFTGNRFSRFGKALEDFIADCYCYWEADGDANLMLTNRDNRKKFRSVSTVNGIYWNEKYPWLFASLDRRILCDPRGRGILETKNTTTMEKDRYTHGFNKSFYLQVQEQLLVYEAEFADVAIYFDGNNFEVRPVEPDKEVQQYIVEETREFWLKVEKARAIKHEYGIQSYYGQHMDFIPEELREAVSMLQALEPELTGTENEYEFLSKLIKPTPEFTEREATPEEYDRLFRYNKAGKLKKKIEAVQTAIKEELVLALGGYHVARFNEKQYFSFKPSEKQGPKLYITPSLFKE